MIECFIGHILQDALGIWSAKYCFSATLTQLIQMQFHHICLALEILIVRK